MLSRIEKTPALRWLGKQLFNREDPAAYFDPLLESVNPMWIQQYTPAQVEEIRDETADTKTFVLRPASRWSGFKAGQHVNICVEIDGIRRNRTFSLSCAPEQWEQSGTITLTIKRFPGGLVTNWMHDSLETGSVIGLGEAFGEFMVPDQEEPVLYIAGGSGITPVLSQLEHLAAAHYKAPVTLLYYVRTADDVIAAERLHGLRNSWPALTLKVIHTHEGSKPRYMNDEDLNTVPGLKARRCYLCGPKGLMDLATDLLYQRGIGEDRMHSTFFAAAAAPIDGQDMGGEVHFESSNLDVSSEGDAVLLEIAEAAKLNPRYGCRMGICHQCSCRKTSGTVVNKLTGKTSGPGEEDIQLCISIPKGPVTIDL